MRKYKTLSCEPSPDEVLNGNESEGPSLVLELLYTKHPTETCFYWFDLLITEQCRMGLLLPLSCSHGGRHSLQVFSGVNLPWQQESRTAPWDLATCSCRSFSLRSKGMAASKAQFGHSSRPVAVHSGRAIPWTLREESMVWVRHLPAVLRWWQWQQLLFLISHSEPTASWFGRSGRAQIFPLEMLSTLRCL